MPKSRGPRRERTHDWRLIQQYSLWPEQKAYELLRPVVLFHEPAASRAQETDTAERTVQYHATQFDQQGMVSLFAKSSAPTPAPSQSLPPDMRQLIVDLHAEYPDFHLREIAAICYVRFGRKPSHHSVKLVLAAGPAPSRSSRRFPPYAQITDPFQRRLAVVCLHAEGWSVTTISRYLQTTRNRVYEILQRWVREDLAGLHDQSHAPKAPSRKVTFEAITQVRKLAVESPELGAFRVRAALEQLGIALSQATCGRLLALNRQLYGLERPKRSAAPKREMPFKARFRHDTVIGIVREGGTPGVRE